MKRVLCLTLAVMMLLMLLSGCADKGSSAAEAAVLSGTEVTAAPGERVVVQVVLSGMESLKSFCNGRLAGFQFSVKVNGLNVVGAETELPDADGASSWTVDDRAQSDGSYLVMIVDMNLVGIETQGAAEIARIYMDVPADGAGEYTVEYTITDFCDTDANSDVTDQITVRSSKVIVQ